MKSAHQSKSKLEGSTNHGHNAKQQPRPTNTEIQHSVKPKHATKPEIQPKIQYIDQNSMNNNDSKFKPKRFDECKQRCGQVASEILDPNNGNIEKLWTILEDYRTIYSFLILFQGETLSYFGTQF